MSESIKSFKPIQHFVLPVLLGAALVFGYYKFFKSEPEQITVLLGSSFMTAENLVNETQTTDKALDSSMALQRTESTVSSNQPLCNAIPTLCPPIRSTAIIIDPNPCGGSGACFPKKWNLRRIRDPRVLFLLPKAHDMWLADENGVRLKNESTTYFATDLKGNSNDGFKYALPAFENLSSGRKYQLRFSEPLLGGGMRDYSYGFVMP